MFARDLHLVLAWVSLGTMAAVAAEAAYRTWVRRPPGSAATMASGAVLLLLGMTAAGGLALLVQGRRPQEWLHFLYAVLAFAAVPIADSVAASRSSRGRAGARLVGSVLAIVLVVRLFSTG